MINEERCEVRRKAMQNDKFRRAQKADENWWETIRIKSKYKM